MSKDVDRIVAVDEFIAQHGEKYQELPVMQRFFSKAKQLLRDMGFTIDFTNNDIINMAGAALKAEGIGAEGEGFRFLYADKKAGVKNWNDIRSRQLASEGLQTAIRDKQTDERYTGKLGQTHAELVKEAPIGGKYEAGFVDREGNFLTRKEAEDKYGVGQSEDIWFAMGNPNARTDLTADEQKSWDHESEIRYRLFGNEFDPNNSPDIKGNDITAHAKDIKEKVENVLTPGLNVGRAISQGIKTLLAPTTKSPKHLEAAEDLGKHLGYMHRMQEESIAKIDGKLGEFGKHENSLSGFFDSIGVFDDRPLEDNPGMKFGSDVSMGRFDKMDNTAINKRYGTTGLQANRIKEAAPEPKKK